MADHDTAKCLVKRCICCSQVQNFSCLDSISCTSELIIILLFLSPELQIVLWPNLVWWCIIISCSVLWKIVLLCSRSRTQWMLRLSLNVYLNKIFWKIETFVAKLGTVMHHHEPVSCKRIVLLSSKSRSQCWLIIKIWSSVFVPAGSISSSSAFKIFWDANHLWWLLCHRSKE